MVIVPHIYRNEEGITTIQWKHPTLRQGVCVIWTDGEDEADFCWSDGKDHQFATTGIKFNLSDGRLPEQAAEIFEKLLST